MYKGQDRRNHKRVKKPFMVRFQICSGHEEELPFAGWDMVAVIDIGAGGTLFYYNKRLKEDSLLNMKINFSAEEEPIICYGKIIRIEELKSPEMFLVAVGFTDIAEKDRHAINRIAERLHA